MPIFFEKKALKRWECGVSAVGYPPVGIQVVKGKPLYVGLAEKREVRAERLRTWVLLLEDGKDCKGCESLGERFGEGGDLFPYKKGS